MTGLAVPQGFPFFFLGDFNAQKNVLSGWPLRQNVCLSSAFGDSPRCIPPPWEGPPRGGRRPPKTHAHISLCHRLPAWGPCPPQGDLTTSQRQPVPRLLVGERPCPWEGNLVPAPAGSASAGEARTCASRADPLIGGQSGRAFAASRENPGRLRKSELGGLGLRWGRGGKSQSKACSACDAVRNVGQVSDQASHRPYPGGGSELPLKTAVSSVLAG